MLSDSFIVNEKDVLKMINSLTKASKLNKKKIEKSTIYH